MRRDLPPRPSLEHLKKQAKDLLDAHHRGDPDAIARIREAVPSFATMSDAAIASAPFALHDAQSAIAREHGKKSWNELRAAVAASAAAAPPSEELMRALMPLPFPEAVGAALSAAWARRTLRAKSDDSALAASLPLVAMRNALFVPGSLAPIHVARAATLAALDAAAAQAEPRIAVFAQRAAEVEDVDEGALHPIGCEAIVHARIPDDARAWIVIEGTRWIALRSLTPRGRFVTAHIAPVLVDKADAAAEMAALADSLRARARALAQALPGGATLLSTLDALDPEQLADLVVANLPVSVEEKARYASEPKLVERLRIALDWIGRSP